MLPKHVQQWFAMRRLNEETLKQFGVWWNGTDIVIPIKDWKGKTLFNKYRRDPAVDTGPKYKYDTGSKISLFNYTGEGLTLIMTEGELDAMLLSSLGYHAISSTGGSQSFQKEWMEYFNHKKLYICFDNDTAGIKGALKTAWLFNPEWEVFLVPFPEYFRGKDVTDYLQHHSKEEFEGLLEKSFKIPRHFKLTESIEASVQIRRTLRRNNLSTALIEEHLRLLNEAKDKQKKFKRTISGNYDTTKLVPIDRFIDVHPVRLSKCINPEHNDKNPSMKWYTKTNSLYCFSCAYSGDVISVVRLINNCSFPEAIKILQRYL